MYGGGAAGAAAGAAAAAAVANATRASGAIVRLVPTEFKKILERIDKPLVVYAEGGFFGKNYQYLTSYKGLFFFCKANEPLHLPGTVETIISDKIWIPGN
jgi:hypothetical protein